MQHAYCLNRDRGAGGAWRKKNRLALVPPAGHIHRGRGTGHRCDANQSGKSKTTATPPPNTTAASFSRRLQHNRGKKNDVYISKRIDVYAGKRMDVYTGKR